MSSDAFTDPWLCCVSGTEFVRPVVGYFCNLCQVIYADEDEAKEQHCSSEGHYRKYQVHTWVYAFILKLFPLLPLWALLIHFYFLPQEKTGKDPWTSWQDGAELKHLY